MTKASAALVILALACAPDARAGTADSMASAIGTCAAQADPQARLACYDQLAAKLKVESPPAAQASVAPAAPAAAPPAAPQATASATPVEEFGQTPPPGKQEHSWYDVGGWFGGNEPARSGPMQTPAQFGAEDVPKNEPPPETLPVKLDKITAKVTSVAYNAPGRFTVELDNGQVWRQVPGDSASAAFNPASGDTVTISRGFMGSYNLVVEGNQAMFKVRRDR